MMNEVQMGRRSAAISHITKCFGEKKEEEKLKPEKYIVQA
jgi:hypothetical protein